jgi:hypothetical protein
VLTNHFSSFGGSEIVALEVALWFRGQGDDVILGANYINAPIDAHAQDIHLTRQIETLELSDFDLVWCQHDLLTLLPNAAFERAARGKMPHFALVSLSPYEPYEHVDAALMRALSAELFANSPETSAALQNGGIGKRAGSRLKVFYNAAPATFWREVDAPQEMNMALRSATFISNHLPPELTDVRVLLELAGIETLHFGLGGECLLIRPEEIGATDAVITIGKSVIYAIAHRKPVYMYDRFGGDGWLTRANASASLAYNFSGRPTQRRLDADALFRELTEGFGHAAQEANLLHESLDMGPLRLDHHLSALRQRALRGGGAWPRWNLRRHLAQATFRAHLETLRAKSNIMKRNFLLAQPQE